MSERKNFLYNLSLFGFTSLLFVSYSIVFARHIYQGLSSDVLDELVWVTTLCATIFHAQAVHTSYQTYLESQGGALPPLTVGPFTILPTISRQTATPVLPSASRRQRSLDEHSYDRLMAATPDLEEENSVYPGDSSMIIVSPPTPSSPSGEYAYPTLQTPGSDEPCSTRIQDTGETPTRPGTFRKISGEWFGRRQVSEDDLERGHEMVGLGMGVKV